MSTTARDALLTLLEVAFVLVALAGVAWFSIPIALILGGVLGAIACEFAARRDRPAELHSASREPGTAP